MWASGVGFRVCRVRVCGVEGVGLECGVQGVGFRVCRVRVCGVEGV